LFKLGYVDRPDTGLTPTLGTLSQVHDLYSTLRSPPSLYSTLLAPFTPTLPTLIHPRQTVHIAVLGDNAVGKGSLVWYLSDLPPPGGYDREKGVIAGKPYDTIVVGSMMMKIQEGSAGMGPGVGGENIPSSTLVTPSPSLHTPNTPPTSLCRHTTSPYCMTMSAIPMDHIHTWLPSNIHHVDVILFMYQCGEMDSLDTIQKLATLIPAHITRLIVCNKMDTIDHCQSEKFYTQHEKAFEKASLYALEHLLPSIQCISTLTGKGISEVLQTIHSIVLHPEQAQPKAYKLKKTSSWFGCSQSSVIGATVVTAAALGITLLYHRYHKEMKDWLYPILGISRPQIRCLVQTQV
jgi:GTPase SAR1 family protein